MAELRRSFALAAAQSYIGVALQLVSTVVLSRVLTPAEVGVFVVASAFGALATNFRDFGIAEYLIQARTLSRQNIRAAFAVNIAMSWLMGLAMFLGAGFAGEFYRSDVVASVMRIQSISFLLIPFGAINQAWFRREMNFKPIFIAGVLSDSVALVLAIVLARSAWPGRRWPPSWSRCLCRCTSARPTSRAGRHCVVCARCCSSAASPAASMCWGNWVAAHPR